MRYKDLITETENPFNWTIVIKSIRQFVLNSIKGGFKQDLTDMMFNTDTFHDTDSMDEVYTSLNSGDLERIHDAVDQAVVVMGELIVSYFKDPMNFAPGYKVPSSLGSGVSGVSEAQLKQILLPGAPKVLADIINNAEQDRIDAEAMRAEHDAQNKENLSRITPERFAELVNQVVTTFPTGLQMLFEYLKSYPEVWHLGKASISVDEMKSIDTLEAFGALVKRKLSSEPTDHYVDFVLSTIDESDLPGWDDVARTINTIESDPVFKKKFYNAIYKQLK